MRTRRLSTFAPVRGPRYTRSFSSTRQMRPVRAARVAATPGAAAALPAGTAAFTVIALGLAAVGVPLWTAAAAAWGAGAVERARVVVGALGLLVAIVAFQAVAAGRLPPVLLIAAPLIVFLDGARARYRARRP